MNKEEKKEPNYYGVYIKSILEKKLAYQLHKLEEILKVYWKPKSMILYRENV